MVIPSYPNLALSLRDPASEVSGDLRTAQSQFINKQGVILPGSTGPIHESERIADCGQAGWVSGCHLKW